jgi:hypothetical protein
MKVCTIDGVAYYAKHLLRAKLPDGPIRFPACEEGIYCFTDRDMDRAQAWLKEQGIEYAVEDLPAPPNWSRTAGVKYMSNEEVLAHIRDGIEPESMIIPRLQERVKVAEERAAAAEKKAARVDLIEARLQSLEKAQKLAE